MDARKAAGTYVWQGNRHMRMPTCGSIQEGGSSSAGTLLFSDAQLHLDAGHSDTW